MIPVYRLHQIVCRRQGQVVLDIDDLVVQPASFTVIIGDNGAGKSTLLKLLALIESANQGTMQLNGAFIHRKNRSVLRRTVGLVLQNPYLLRGSVLSNVELGLRLQGCSAAECRRRARQALSCLALDSLASRAVDTLSGGEAQIVAVARTLALEPEVLLLDEPLTYLDQAHAALIEEAMLFYVRQQGKTVLFSSHERLRGLALADHNVNLMSGKLIPMPLLNVLTGAVQNGYFLTRGLSIRLEDPCPASAGRHAVISPDAIRLFGEPPSVISGKAADNRFQGRVTGITEQGKSACVTVLAGQKLQVFISHSALRQLRLGLDKTVWVHFEPAAVHVF